MISLSRRRLLALGGATMALGTPNASVAARDGRDPRLALILLRGALDGLAAVAPYGDPSFRELRGALAMAEPGQPNGLLDLGGRFGLHPALAPLHALYAKGDLAFLHATCGPYRGRSHFDGQNMLESGRDQPSGSATGWLARAVDALGPQPGDRRLGLAIGAGLPLALRGETRVATWAPAAPADLGEDLMARILALHAHDPLTGPALTEGMRAQMTASAVLGADARPGMAGGPRGGLGPDGFTRLCTTAAKLMAPADGPRLAVLEIGGWDTHAQQNGRLPGFLAALAAGIVALADASGPAWRDTLVIAATEFGRTVRANGTGGTDHGTGGVALIAGGRVAGGRVLGDWPGLADGRLLDGRDLMPTTDLRSLFAAALVEHQGMLPSIVANRVFDGGRVIPTSGLFRV
jgi:uncharacterized protein (DUF1501 family)